MFIQVKFIELVGFILFFYMYPFLVYPLFLYILTSLKKPAKVKVIDSTYELPFVSIIIAAFNEASSIAKKIENILSLDYSMNKLEIIIVSDGSTDSTVAISSGFPNPNIHVIELNERKGKIHAQNIGVAFSKGDVLVFSDANTVLEKSALKNIVSCLLSSDRIGCVSGNLIYLSNNRIIGEAEYQRYDTLIKKLESNFFSAIGVNGAFYALRKRDFVILPDDIISDFVEPLEIYRKYRKITVFCENAKCFEEEPHKNNEITSIVERKSRIVVRGLRGLFYVKELLNPLKHPIMAFELISHKLMRWTSTWLLFLIYFLPLLYFNSFGLRIFAIENLVICLTFLFYLVYKRISKRLPILDALFYFLSLILAEILAWYYFLSGRTFKTWTTKR